DIPHAICMLEHALAQCRAADIPLYFAWDYGHFGFGLRAVRAGHRGAAPVRPGRSTANYRRRRGRCEAPPGRGVPRGRSGGRCAAIALYRDMAMTFWLPQTEATLAQVLGMHPVVAPPTEGPIRHLKVPGKSPRHRGSGTSRRTVRE